MQLHEYNITEIPSNAFNNSQDNLNYLFLIGESFKKLGSNAFSNLKSLIHLDIIDTSIDFIPENAFEFNEESNQSQVLTLASDQLLNSSSFAEKSLTKFKRPTTLLFTIIGNASYQYLDQKIFEPFLLSNAENLIQIYTGSISCSDCRNNWLKKNISLQKRIVYLKCSNKKMLNDTGNFQNCSH